MIICKICRFLALGFSTFSLSVRGAAKPATNETKEWEKELYNIGGGMAADKRNLLEDRAKIGVDLRHAFNKSVHG